MKNHIANLLQNAVNSTADGIALLDSESKYFYLNEAHVKQFGYENQSELLGKSWHVFYSKEEIARIERDIFPLLMKNGTWSGETTGLTKQGFPIAQEITLAITPDGGLICVTRILTEIREAQVQINTRDESIAAVVHNSTTGILLESADRVIIEINKQLGSLLDARLDPIALKGTNCLDALPFVKGFMKEPESFIDRIDYLIKEGVPTFDELIELKDGSFLERDFIPVIVDHRVTGFLWMYRDVTEHEQTKAYLNSIIAKEKQLNDLRSKLVRTISHEFKAPIISTLAGIELLQNQFKNSGDVPYSEALNHIVSELSTLNDRIKQLTRFETLQNHQEVQKKHVSAKNLISNFLNYNYKLFVLSSKFNVNDTLEHEQISVNLELFNLALKNVIDNALKYSDHHEKISISCQSRSNLICFSFSNNVATATIPDLDQLGKPLYRANPTDDMGLGLGLGIIEHVMDIHSGVVEYSIDDNIYTISIKFICEEVD